MDPVLEGTLTFLFSDIEGSTRRWAERPGMAEALVRHDEIVRSAIARSGGHWVKHTGDGVFAVFGQPSGAVKAAIEIQRAIGSEFAEDPMFVRIGLHTGEAEWRGEDVFGLAVSTAARIMDAAHGGQIIVSEATKLLIGPTDDFDLIDMGQHRMKDLGTAHHLFQVAAHGIEGRFPPLRTLESVDHNLPIQLTSFIGRDKELAQIVDLISTHRLVTLTGVGGAGKTRLSLQAAAEVADSFRDGVRFVELASVSDPEMVVPAIASGLGVRHEQKVSTGLVDRIVEHLAAAELLLVVDNCEHVLGSAASLIAKILAGAPDVTVVASSREGLGVAGEWIWQVPSLTVAGEGELSEASQLFMDRAAAVAPRIEWNDQTKVHVSRICRRLDGIPLAIELAAARTRVLSAEEISDRLGDRFRLLTGGARSALPRQQTLEATVDWSYQLLSVSERRLFERLSVFVGGFTLEAMEAVCTDDQVDRLDALDLLTGLVDKSMVIAERGDSGRSRYRLLETLRQFGVRLLAESNEMQRWKDQHLSYYLGWLEDTEVLGWNPFPDLPRYAAEQGNLAAALEWARSGSRASVPLIASALSVHHFFSLGDPETALSLVQEAVEESEGASLRLEGARLRALHAVGRIDEFVVAWESLEGRLEGADDDDAAWCLARAAGAFAWDPELDVSRAISLARAAVLRSKNLGPEARFVTQMALGTALMWSKVHPREVAPVFRKGADLARDLGHLIWRQYALSMLAMVTLPLDQWEGTDLTTPVEDEMFEIWEMSGRSVREEFVTWISIRRGMWEMAETELALQDPEFRGIQRVQMLMPRATLRWMQGRFDEAESDFDAVASFGPIRRWHHDYYPMRAEVAALRGDRLAARDWVRLHFEVPMEPTEEIMRIATLRALVMAEIDAGDVDAAMSVMERIRSIAGPVEEPRISMFQAMQVGSVEFFVAAAEAELTRAGAPDPEAWERAASLASWRYWTLYCRVRRLEALHVLGNDVTSEIAAVRADAESLEGLLKILDSLD
jgi:predicted ATPase/class 3 adenylate cyclase